MTVGQLFPLTTQPGIKRDGTNFSQQYYNDGQWCRFQRGYPRKIGGYSSLVSTNYTSSNDIMRGIFVVPAAANFNVYLANQSTIEYFTMDQDGIVYNPPNPFNPITPAGFPAQNDYLWQFDSMYSTTTNSQLLLVHPGRNLADINNAIETPIYYTDILQNNALQPIGQSVSGGLCVFHPFLFIFGNFGEVLWSDVNNPFNFSTGGSSQAGGARVASDKIVYGLQTRGGNSSPAGLLWSLGSLIRVTFIGAPEFFRFDTITDESSILSSKSVIEYDGLYFWAGIDRFLVYNGVVQEVPNQMNINFFFDNLNYAQREKVWATKVPRWGEIWWFFPSGNSTECNHAVIYNKRENTWYDTAITRGCGYFEQVFGSPIWVDNIPTIGNNLYTWRHESGVDQNINGELTAIDSFIETGDIAWCAIGPSGQWTGVNRWVDIYRFEPDMILQGDMTLTVKGREYANAPSVPSNPYTFNSSTNKIDIREQRREMTLRFESEVVGGDYQFGQNLLWMRVGDARS